MKKIYILPYICFFFTALFLTSCSTSNKFACSFGKRRYTKGFYIDVPGKRMHKTAYMLSETPHKHIVSAPSLKPILGEVAQKQQVKTTLLPISAKPLLSSYFNRAALQRQAYNKIQGGENGDGDNTKSKSGTINYPAIAGFAASTAGVAIAVIDGFLPILAIVFLIAGAALCVYALTVDKIYFTWLAVIGLSFIVIWLTLIFL